MNTGTAHFESHAAAVAYYRPYVGTPAFRGGDAESRAAARRRIDSEARRMVRDKIAAREIFIGAPEVPPGARLTIHREERRYFITDDK